ncbi:hypothetical protein ES703_102207 [subsurface metagenome]
MSKNRIDWQRVIIPQTIELLKSYDYRPTVRQIFYRLVAALLIPNTKSAYKYLDKILVAAREKGTIDPLAFADRKRESSQGDYGWQGPTDFTEDQKDAFARSWQFYTRPLWTSQQIVPIIWLEKDALFPAVCQIADRYRVKVYESIGYSSCTQIYEAIPEFQSKNVVVLQLGDYDPSGKSIAKSLKLRLEKYGAGKINFIPLALTKQQTIDLRLPTQIAKKSDPRFKTFVEEEGTDRVVELDALPPEKLEKIIAEKIESYIDPETWNEELGRIKKEKKEAKKTIQELADKLRGG